MSVASCSYQVGLEEDGSNITASLLGGMGDLVQYFSGDAASPGSVTPPWSGLSGSDRPYLRTILMETDPDITQAELAGMVVDSDTDWYIDGKKLYFNSSNVSIDNSAGVQGYAGLFRKLTAASGSNHRADAPYGGLEVLGNLVTATNGHSIWVEVDVAISKGSTGLKRKGGTAIKMLRNTGQANFATIYCDSTDSFVLDAKNPDVVCKVRCWQGDVEVTNFTRKWFLIENGAWVQKATTDTFKLTQEMVATFADVKVECYDSNGNFIASDIQTVNDSDDPYVLLPNPTPDDGKFYRSEGPSKISFAPKVVHMDGTAGPACSFYFTVLDSAGNVLNSDSKTKKKTYDLLKEVAVGIGEGPVVNITAEED
ncbi:MAG: hypothetical protein HDS35_00040 [Bacteroides sp.]|nr:hypothetical protein [Bacteroides sp.]